MLVKLMGNSAWAEAGHCSWKCMLSVPCIEKELNWERIGDLVKLLFAEQIALL
jgi:hypothetical protein